MSYDRHDADIDAVLRDPFAATAVAAVMLWLAAVTIPYLATGFPWHHETLATLLCLPLAAFAAAGCGVRAALRWSTQRQVDDYRSQGYERYWG